jgi:hypothetical protein
MRVASGITNLENCFRVYGHIEQINGKIVPKMCYTEHCQEEEQIV